MKRNIILSNTIDELIKERLKQNAMLFTENERQVIKNHFKLMKKIYCLAILDRN